MISLPVNSTATHHQQAQMQKEQGECLLQNNSRHARGRVAAVFQFGSYLSSIHPFQRPGPLVLVLDTYRPRLCPSYSRACSGRVTAIKQDPGNCAAWLDLKVSLVAGV
jgi:hypothetical protein